MLRKLTRNQMEDTKLFLHFAVDVSVFCRQHEWSCVAHLNWYLVHVQVVYTEAEQSLMAGPGSEQRVMGESCSVLTAHGAC